MRCDAMPFDDSPFKIDFKSQILLVAELEASEESSSEQSAASEAGKDPRGCFFVFGPHTQTLHITCVTQNA